MGFVFLLGFEKAAKFQQAEAKGKNIWIEGKVLRKPKGKGKKLFGSLLIEHFSYVIRSELEREGGL